MSTRRAVAMPVTPIPREQLEAKWAVEDALAAAVARKILDARKRGEDASRDLRPEID